MLSRSSKILRSSLLKGSVARPSASILPRFSVSSKQGSNSSFTNNNKRFNSTLTDKPKEVFTKISDESDPNRKAFFEYTWGTWLKNDKAQKAKRRTEFSIKGLNDTFIELSKPIGSSDHTLTEVSSNINAITKNLELLGDANFDNIKQIVSIHEGKHHRVYKFQMEETSNGETPLTEFVLRLPYKLDSSLYTDRRIKSEVATMDFLQSKLNLDVPKVLAYSSTPDNALGSPFMIMEYREGDLLMKQWNPLVSGEINDVESKEKLMSVIGPVADFHKGVTDFKFNQFGSLYFAEDCPVDVVNASETEVYEGENEDAELKGRYVIGPTVERAYYKNKSSVKKSTLDQFVGPWSKDEPLKMVTDLVKLELESFKGRLALAQADASSRIENQGVLTDAIITYEKFLKISDHLFNLKSETIPNMPQLLAPRLHLADLDPMNAIVKEGSDKPAFVDFEGSSIKPYILTSYPQFLQYSGPKIFNLKQDIENFDSLDEIEQQQYEFMFNRTRNQFYWELSLNDRNKELLGVISPAVKLIKNVHNAALDLKNDKDFLYVENGLVELSQMWDSYKGNQLVGGDEFEGNPIEFSEDELKLYEESLQNYQTEISTTPFIATNGWVPQDMFNKLVEQGMVVKDGDDYKLDTEKVLE